jgi:carboxyl-terminal processing protease
MENFLKRFSDGELLTADSIHFPDSLKYKTMINKRTVYGGGGIMPDAFVSADTSFYTPYFSKLSAKAVPGGFALEYFDKNRAMLTSRYKSFEDFKREFQISPEMIKLFIEKGEAEGVRYDEDQFNRSKEEILLVLKGLIATNMWKVNEYYQIINQNDKVIGEALKLIGDKRKYETILGYH